MNQRHKHADVLIAMSEGKEAQYEGVGEWVTVNKNRIDINPLTYPDFKWRIKPDLITVWVNVYEDFIDSDKHATKKEADAKKIQDRIACVPLTYTPGEGL